MSVPKLTGQEVVAMDKMQKEGKSPGQILVSLRARRRRSGGVGPGKSAVYNFLSRQTHRRGAAETRGRKSKIPANLVRVAVAKRRKLIKDAGNEWLVTWGDVHAETKKVLKASGSIRRARDMPSEDWLARQVRDNTEVRARPPKKRIAHNRQHVKQRLEQGRRWLRYSANWWLNGVHAYVDSKKFLLPSAAHQKKLARSARITHHLRTPAEGKIQDFVVPKTAHMLLGVPSVLITAAVSARGMLMWHVTDGSWCGAAAVTCARGSTDRQLTDN